MKYVTKTLFSVSVATCSMLVVAADAPSPISGSLAFTSDYVFRGVSQTSRDPAVQGGLNYNHSSGFHANLWGSNLNIQSSHLEVDYTLGYGLTNGPISWDTSVGLYTYPGAPNALDYNFYEVSLSGAYDFGPAKISGGVWYSPDGMANEKKTSYFMIGLDAPLPNNFAFNAHIGRQNQEINKDYVEWKAGISTQLMGLGVELAYWDTDLKKADCGSNNCDGRTLLTISKSF